MWRHCPGSEGGRAAEAGELSRLNPSVTGRAGSFGEVYKAVWTPRGGEPTLFAVKRLLQESDESRDEAINEAEVMQRLSHPAIVGLKGISLQGAQISLVTEFMDGGCLNQVGRRSRGLHCQYLLGPCS